MTLEEGRHGDTGSLEASSDGDSYEYSAYDHDNQDDSFRENDVSRLVVSPPSVEGTSGWIGAIFLIVNAALGAGLLDFPAAFDQAGGILISMVMQGILLTFAILSMLMLAYCAKKHSCSTYQEVMLRTCGRPMERVCSIVIVLYTYGTCITFVIILGDLSDRTLSSLYGNTFCHHWYLTRQVIMTAICVLFILPLCFPKQIDFLKYPSSLGVLAVFYIVGLIVYEFYMGGFPTPPDVKTAPDHWEDVLTVIPVICFGYQCHVSSVPIYACMEDKKVSTFARSILAAIAICALVYSVAGIYGYLTFGTNVDSDVLLAFEASNPIVLVGFVALGLKIITTYPILMFCGRLALDDLLPKSGAIVRCSRFAKRMMLSLLWFATTVLIACVVPNISVAISCIGSMAALFIFVFPPFALLGTSIQVDELYAKGKTRVIIAYTIVSVLVGIFVFGQVLSKSIWQIISDEDSSKTIILCH